MNECKPNTPNLTLGNIYTRVDRPGRLYIFCDVKFCNKTRMIDIQTGHAFMGCTPAPEQWTDVSDKICYRIEGKNYE